MCDFTELWPGGPRFAAAPHFPLNTDSILLADFAGEKKARKGIDLGCASGLLALLLMQRQPALHMTGLEILPEAAALAAVNFAENQMAERSCVLTGDIREYRSLLKPGAFDLVVSNPPYFPCSSGPSSPLPQRAGAREELSCSLDELCSCAAWALQTGGAFFLVHRPERLSELFCALTAHALEPKRLRPVCYSPRSAPSLVLVEARRGGRPGLTMEKCLFLTDEKGEESAEYRRIYHRG